MTIILLTAGNIWNLIRILLVGNLHVHLDFVDVLLPYTYFRHKQIWWESDSIIMCTLSKRKFRKNQLLEISSEVIGFTHRNSVNYFISRKHRLNFFCEGQWLRFSLILWWYPYLSLQKKVSSNAILVSRDC